MSNLENNAFVSKKSEIALQEHISKLNSKNYSIPTKVEEITGFPFINFEEVHEKLANNDVQLLRFAFQTLGEIIESLNPTPQWTINLLITFLVPLISICLAIFYSWWFVFGLLSFFVGVSKTKKLYNYTVFKAAMTNELAFCFLFYTGQISISNSTRTAQYAYNIEKADTKKYGTGSL